MIFLKPEYFLMLLIPLIVFFYFIMSNKGMLEVYFDEKVLEKLRFENNTLGRMGRNILLFAAFVMMITALARPVLEKGDVKISAKQIDMMVALDISKSMMAADFYPSRLAFAKKRFIEFVDAFKEANIGVIAFSSQGFLVSPMTQDKTTLKYLVNNLSLDSLSLKGTDLFIPIEKAHNFLEKSKDKILIIFSDGGDDETFESQIQKAKEYGESIYIYAVGTPEGAPIREDGEAIKDKEGNMVITRLNEKIKTLAFETGGAYIVGNHDDNSVKLLVDEIKKSFKAHVSKEKKIKEYQELFYYPLTLALLFMLFAFHSLPKMRTTIMIMALLSMFSPQDIKAKVFDFKDISQAKEAYKSQEFEKAQTHYENLVKSNKSPQSVYDLANTQYKLGKYKEALSTYANVTANEPSLKYKRSFNQGNAHFQLKEYEKAVKAYEAAKKIQTDEDLEHNLALAKKKIEEKKKQKKNKDKKKDKKDQDKKDQKKKEDQDKKKKDDKDKKDKQKQEQEKKDKEEQQKQKQENKAQEKQEISKKEEKMWQQHLEKLRPKTMPMKLETKPSKRTKNEKPW